MTAAPQSIQPSIVERLRSPDYGWSGDALAVDCSVAEEAADRIEFLEFEWNRATEGMQERDKRIQELEGALRFLFGDTKWKSVDRDNMEFEGRVTCYQLERARAALEAKPAGEMGK